MKPKSGYTIIEVLVAIVLLAIALPGLTTMVIASRKVQVGSERHESSVSFGQAVLDSLLLLPTGTIPAEGTKVQSVNGTSYTATWRRSADAKASTLVRLTVAWTVGGQAHTTTLQGVAP